MSHPSFSSPFRLELAGLSPRSSSVHRCCRIRLEHPIGTPMLGLSQGDTFTIDVKLSVVDQGILLHMVSHPSLKGQCSRCLQAITMRVDVDTSAIYFYPDERQKLINEGDEDAQDYPLVDGNSIDIESEFIDALTLQIPYQPLCTTDCQGLCPDCGKAYAELPSHHHHDHVDPRFAALRTFFKG